MKKVFGKKISEGAYSWYVRYSDPKRNKKFQWVDAEGQGWHNQYPSDEILAAEGYMLVSIPEYDNFTHELTGAHTDDGVTISPTVVEKSPATVRAAISNEIYSAARFYIDQTSSDKYSTVEQALWTENEAAMDANNTAHFARMAGSRLTAQQYIDTRFKPKVSAGKPFVHMIIGKRTDLLYDLGQVPDDVAQLKAFRDSMNTIWDDVSDFTPPPPEEVSESLWQSFINTVTWWK